MPLARRTSRPRARPCSTMWCGEAVDETTMSARSSCGRKVVEAHGLPAEALREADRAVVVAVGDEHRAHAALDQRLARSARRSRRRRRSRPRAPARSPSVSCASWTATELTDSGPAAIAGLGAHALAGGERLAEQPVHDRAGGVLDQRQLVGALDLALDLRLADDHRVEARGDAEQVARGVLVAQRVEVRRPARSGGCRPGGRGSRARWSRPRRRRRPPCRARCGCRSRARPPRRCARPTTSSRSTLDGAALGQRDALAQLDRRGLVRDADHEQLAHDGAPVRGVLDHERLEAQLALGLRASTIASVLRGRRIAGSLVDARLRPRPRCRSTSPARTMSMKSE